MVTMLDHTTAIAQRASKGKGRAQNAAAGRSAAEASMKQMEYTHQRIVDAGPFNANSMVICNELKEPCSGRVSVTPKL
jgi:hypothetical protein